ncbi:hypothetical protein JXA80_06425 [bacterium]|nr:hypothetical protein [candidate division CSSED10-310 bacterium]
MTGNEFTAGMLPLARRWFLHPLSFLLMPGLISLTVAPPLVVLSVLLVITACTLVGVSFSKTLIPQETQPSFLVWAAAIPIGILVSNALATAMILSSGFSAIQCLIPIGLTGIICNRVLRLHNHHSTGGSIPDRDAPSTLSPRSVAVSLICVSVLVILLVLPYSRVGMDTPDGIAYRAYYSGDYLKHVAVAATLPRSALPPENPYFAGETLHYYWMFYLLPAMVIDLLGPDSVEPVIRTVNLFLASVFIWIWILTVSHFIRREWIRWFVVWLPFAFASYEGLAVFRQVLRKAWPWDGFRAFNVDGYSRWILGHPEIDTVFRLIQYNVQHIIPTALCLLFLVVLQPRSRNIRSQQALLMGILCGLAIGHSGFLGSFLTLWTGICLAVVGPWNATEIRKRVVLCIYMAVPPVLALLLYRFVFDMLGNTGNPLQLTLVQPIARHPIPFFVLNFGVAILGFPLLFHRRHVNTPTAILAGLSLIWVAGVMIPEWPSDVGVKVGYTLALSLALLTGHGLNLVTGTRLRTAIAIPVCFAAAIGALPTLAMEIFNACDIQNHRFVSFIDPADWDAYRFMRDQLPINARIQGGPETTDIQAPFSPIPTFAHRNTYCGDWMHAHIFLIPETHYRIRLDQITRMYQLHDPLAVHGLCRDAGITHLYWGATEFTSFGNATHLLERPDLFPVKWSHVEENKQLYLFAIRPRAAPLRQP